MCDVMPRGLLVLGYLRETFWRRHQGCLLVYIGAWSWLWALKGECAITEWDRKVYRVLKRITSGEEA